MTISGDRIGKKYYSLNVNKATVDKLKLLSEKTGKAQVRIIDELVDNQLKELKGKPKTAEGILNKIRSMVNV